MLPYNLNHCWLPERFTLQSLRNFWYTTQNHTVNNDTYNNYTNYTTSMVSTIQNQLISTLLPFIFLSVIHGYK